MKVTLASEKQLSGVKRETGKSFDEWFALLDKQVGPTGGGARSDAVGDRVVVAIRPELRERVIRVAGEQARRDLARYAT